MCEECEGNDEELVCMLFKAAASKMAASLPEEKVQEALSMALLSLLAMNIKGLDDLNKFELMKDGIKSFSEKTIKLLEKEKDAFETFMAEHEASSSSKH